MARRTDLLLGALLALAALPTRAIALEWLSDRFEGATQPLQSTLQVAFGFRNAGDKPVAIRAIQTNCDCLAAGANKSQFAPGEAGLVTARFTVGDRYGSYERVITVVTDDSAEPKRLHVRIEVPEPASTSPTILVWTIGAAPEEKPVELRTAPGVQINFTEAFPSNTDFRVRLETIEPGSRYRLHITPARTDAPANAAIRAKGTAPDGREIVTSAYANVR